MIFVTEATEGALRVYVRWEDQGLLSDSSFTVKPGESWHGVQFERLKEFAGRGPVERAELFGEAAGEWVRVSERPARRAAPKAVRAGEQVGEDGEARWENEGGTVA